jgi:hypothetical protein
LEEEETETAGGADGGERVDELGDVGLGVAEALEMGDALRGFEAESEVSGRRAKPGFEGFGGGECTEGVVDLDGVELGCVELEEFFGGDVGGIEAGLPGGIGPAGGSYEEVGRKRDGRCERRGLG